jgi:coproporphyrinogen III oxidase-like Fe-S oxidoreductase
LNLESRYGSNFSEKLSKSLIKETETILKFTNISSIRSIYFGGGTPSLAPPSTFHALIQFLKRNFDVNDNAEITIECNPSSENMLSKLEEYAKSGINRVSIGLQVLCFKIIYHFMCSSTIQ